MVSSTPRPYFTPGRTQYPLYRRLVGPQGRSGRADILAPPGFDPRAFQPVAESLYRLSYPVHTYMGRGDNIDFLIVFWISRFQISAWRVAALSEGLHGIR